MLTREMILEELNNRNLKYGDYETNLIIDYLINLYELNLLPENITYKDLIAKLEKYNVNIVFFDDNHEVNQKWGHKFKGSTHTDENGNITIYVRNSLVDKEIYFYHELTHLFQKKQKENISIDCTGLRDKDGRGALINEVATQSVAEKIYNNKHNLSSEFILYDSGNLRMLPGYEIWSDLKNYQMYDYITSLLLQSLNLTKDNLIKKAFDEDIDFIDILKEKAKELSWITPDSIIYLLEYIFLTDLIIYTNHDQRKELYNGESLNYEYCGEEFVGDFAINRETQLHFYKLLCDKFKMEIENKEELKTNNLN